MRDLSRIVEIVHALIVVLWIAGMPLLFWRRWPRLTRWYGVYAIGFVLISQGSHHLLGECFITTLARDLWERGAPDPSAGLDEWFTVRLAQRLFGLTPSHRAIVLVWEAGIVITAIGALLSLRAGRRRRVARAGERHAGPQALRGCAEAAAPRSG